jgi:hypothetical protein
MSDFYSDLSPAQPRVLVSKYGAPGHITRGADGIPDYVDASKGSPYQYMPPPGFRLAIFHNGVRLRHVVIADRKRGFAIGRHYKEDDKEWTVTFLPYDENGVHQERFYEGNITFKLIYGPGPKVFGIYG